MSVNLCCIVISKFQFYPVYYNLNLFNLIISYSGQSNNHKAYNESNETRNTSVAAKGVCLNLLFVSIHINFIK